jgi:hypothetical protein
MTLDEPAKTAAMKRVPMRGVVTMAACVAAGFGLGYVVHRAPAPAAHTVEFGLSAYPATASAWWVDADRKAHNSLPWNDKISAAGLRSATIVVANTDGAPVSCTLIVDGQAVDSHTANRQGDIAVCDWTF